MDQTEFTSKMIEEITDLKVNTLHYYVQSGAIIPDIDLGEGTGKSRKFSETNCMEAKIILLFIQYGIPRRTIVKILKKIRENAERDRLNPRKISNKPEGTCEYLLISHAGKKSSEFIYRFVSDGGEKYSSTRKEWKSRNKLTSYNGLESIRDFLSFPVPVKIVFDLSILCFGVPMRGYKLGDRYR